MAASTERTLSPGNSFDHSVSIAYHGSKSTVASAADTFSASAPGQIALTHRNLNEVLERERGRGIVAHSCESCSVIVRTLPSLR